LLALYNRSNNLKVPIYQIHDAPINCLSFCSWDTHKLFSTSHDGSVRCGDLVKCTFDTVSINETLFSFFNYTKIRIVIIIIKMCINRFINQAYGLQKK